jgi:NADH pyrophosphatase NudC (nudix superfamily)
MKEETGIDVQYVATVGFRELPRAIHGKGNLFFMCLCKLVGDEDITIQASELAAARWMPIDEVMALPYYQGVGAYGELMRASMAAARSETDGLQRLRLPVSHDPKRGEHTIYVPRARL